MNDNHKKYYTKKLQEAHEIVSDGLKIDTDADVYPHVLVAVFNKIAVPVDQVNLIS